MSCGLAFGLGFGWLGFIVTLSALCLRTAAAQTFVQNGKASTAGVAGLALLFLIPKSCIVGVSLARSKTEQFSYSALYPALGFLIVSATLILAAACVLLSQGGHLTRREARDVVARAGLGLHTILTMSVAVHVLLAGLFSSQRELSVLHGCVDLSQLYVLTLIAILVDTGMGPKRGLAVSFARSNKHS